MMKLYSLEERRNFLRSLNIGDPGLKFDLTRVHPVCSSYLDTEDDADLNGRMAFAVAVALAGEALPLLKATARIHRDGLETHLFMRPGRDGIIDPYLPEWLARGVAAVVGTPKEVGKSVYVHWVDQPALSGKRAWNAKSFDAPFGLDPFGPVKEVRP